MTSEDILKIRQDIVGILDTLFNKVISGVSVEQKNHERFYECVRDLSTKIGQLSETVALEKCRALNEATKKAFQLMEADIEKKVSRIK